MSTAQADVPTLSEIRDRLDAIGQEHLLSYHDELDEPARRALLAQIASLDLERVPSYVEEYVLSKPDFSIDASALEPLDAYPRPGQPGRTWNIETARDAGEQLLRAGKVAAFTVAGGQGSRLGYDGPKGEYPAGAVTGKPLFACLAEWILAAERRFGSAPPWYIMTSPLNHAPTQAFFEKNRHFGLKPADVIFFQQGVMPSFDLNTGKILLADRHAVATNPDGHGGSLKALDRSGAIDDMARRGIEQISYAHVDNPLVRVIDPVFIGLHLTAEDSSAEMSSKMVPKRGPKEKVGILAKYRGKTAVIEYSDLPDELAEQTDDAGTLRFNAGSIGIHIIAVDFVRRLNAGGDFSLPFHRAEKKVPHIDLATGRHVEPTSPNAVKLETFVFDALPLAERSIVYETDRIDEFAPIKNAEGIDSPASSARIQTERTARMLEAAGVHVPRTPEGEPDCTLEISPLTAMHADDIDPATIEPIHPGDKRAL